MLIYILYALLLALVLWLATRGNEGYFTFYQGMPGIPKTYISPHFVRNYGNCCAQNSDIV